MRISSPSSLVFRRAAVASAALMGLGVGSPAVWAQGPLAPLQEGLRPSLSALGLAPVGSVLPQRYIVTLKEGLPAPVEEVAARLTQLAGGELIHVYRHSIKGFALQLPDVAVAALRLNPLVAAIEPDRVVGTRATQGSPVYGLDRIDQRRLPLDGAYNYDSTGAGIKAYIIDTGIRRTHSEFAGRVGAGFTAVNDGNGTNDCDGHGTHVAGTVGGSTYGVAKGVELVPVRVLDCSGSGATSGVIAGVDWVAQNAPVRSVANMSLGGGASAALDNAVNAVAARGVVMAVAAGNDNGDACSYSPARAVNAVTVGATTNTDARASYSNFGSCVDLFAPGSNIVSAGIASDTATATLSGTSMASPHVAGVAALMLARDANLSGGELVTRMKAASTVGAVGSAGTGSANRLLYQVAVNLAPASLKSLTTTTSRSLLNWTANVVVTAVNPITNAAVAGTLVTAQFGTAAPVTCVTNASGACTVTGTFSRTATSTTFRVSDISGNAFRYDAANNQRQPSTTIARP